MIVIRRGTTNEFVIALTNEDGSTYKISNTDTLIFGVKHNVRKEDYVLSKTVGAGDYDDAKGGYVVAIVPDDTQDLPFGEYIYDVGLQKSTGEFYIVCHCDTFKIADAVTERVE